MDFGVERNKDWEKTDKNHINIIIKFYSKTDKTFTIDCYPQPKV